MVAFRIRRRQIQVMMCAYVMSVFSADVKGSSSFELDPIDHYGAAIIECQQLMLPARTLSVRQRFSKYDQPRRPAQTG